MEPLHPPQHVIFFCLNFQEGRVVEAVADLNRAVETSDASPPALHYLAKALKVKLLNKMIGKHLVVNNVLISKRKSRLFQRASIQVLFLCRIITVHRLKQCPNGRHNAVGPFEEVIGNIYFYFFLDAP